MLTTFFPVLNARTPQPFPVAGFYGLVCCCFFADLHHDPALPKYENENNEAKKHVDREQRRTIGLASDGHAPLLLVCPAM